MSETEDVGDVDASVVRAMAEQVENAGLFSAGDLLRQVAELMDGPRPHLRATFVAGPTP